MRELKLNTLGRYGKNASHLVLEEHSHCEVPAGCGDKNPACRRQSQPSAPASAASKLPGAG